MADLRNSGPYGQGEPTPGSVRPSWSWRGQEIRLTHRPTGAWAIGRSERSMHMNHRAALALLRVALARIGLFGAVHPVQDPVRSVDLISGRVEDYAADLAIEGVGGLDLGEPGGCRLLDAVLPTAIRARAERI